MKLQNGFRLVLVGLVLLGCDPTSDSDAVLSEYLDLPNQPYKYHSLEFNDMQIQLGRVLFYDPSLSDNNTISCGSCHKQEYAFGDNVAFSKGFERGFTIRNTLALVDARQTAHALQDGQTSGELGGGLFWDGRRAQMQEAVMEPIFNHIEMGMDWSKLSEKLREIPYYPILFKKAYGDKAITYVGVQTALAAFVGVMRSGESKFERSLTGRSALSAEEQKGLQLFDSKYKCVNCHQGHMGERASFEYQSFAEFANIGLEETYKDKGLSAITHQPRDEGRFRVPNLSNVALTAPYMHDGSIATLEEVLEHYSGGIITHPNLDRRLRDAATGMPLRLDATAAEKQALVAFLKTFTDDDVATNPKLSDPFK